MADTFRSDSRNEEGRRLVEPGWIDFAALTRRSGSEAGARALFEDLVRQLVAIEHPNVGNIEAAPGDWGIDAFVGRITGDVAVWQVKYFMGTLGSAQRRQITESLQRVLSMASEHGFAVVAWTLCLPVDLGPRDAQWWDQLGQRFGEVELTLWGKTQLERRLLTDEAEVVREYYFPTTRRLRPPSVDPVRVDLWRLPATSGDVVGRDRERETLVRAWEGGKTNLVSIVGWGGIGKSALLNVWLADMAARGFEGADNVWGWSFYRQSTAGQVGTPEQFIDSALEWLGSTPSPATSIWERIRELTARLQGHRTLLVLDGLEPLQVSPPSPNAGKVRDPALRMLLKNLTMLNPGLCVVTSRLPLADLLPLSRRTLEEINLEALSPEASVALLRGGGVTGDERTLRAIADATEGHALTLTLLASFIELAHGGDASRWQQTKVFDADERFGGRLERVMSDYDAWFEGTGEEQVLGLVSLFNRPAAQDQLAVLRSPPAVEGLNDLLVDLTDLDWALAIGRLRHTGLLSARSGGGVGDVDAHPIARDHYRRTMEARSQGAVTEGHRRLYEHLRSTAAELPKTLTEMLPLIGAIYHAGKANKGAEALRDVYWPRVAQGRHYLRDGLGAASANHEVLMSVLDQDHGTLSDEERGRVYCDMSIDMRMLGETKAAVELLVPGIGLASSCQDWRQVANSSRHLSQLYVALGDLTAALAAAESAIGFSEREPDRLESFACWAALGDIRHQRGDLAEAETCFRRARDRLSGAGDRGPLTGRVTVQIGLYREIDFRLTSATRSADSERPLEEAAMVCGIAEELTPRGSSPSALATALVRLGALRISGARHGAETSKDELAGFDEVVSLMRTSGQQPWLVEGLICRARCLRRVGFVARAAQDIEEALVLVGEHDLILRKLDAMYEQSLMASDDEQRAGEVALLRAEASKLGYGRLVALLS